MVIIENPSCATQIRHCVHDYASIPFANVSHKFTIMTECLGSVKTLIPRARARASVSVTISCRRRMAASSYEAGSQDELSSR